MKYKEVMQKLGVVGCHIEALMPRLEVMAKTNISILITGETGTGKEHVAQLIHALSNRSEGKLLFVNTSAIHKGLFESELFGHKKGSFTGANVNRDGAIKIVENGTIVLDEIGSLPLESQAKLLRWLENGEIKPVGADVPIKANVRIIACTNKNLQRLIAKGNFREDLYYRLQALNIHLPPLRKNIEAILDLTLYFVQKNQNEFGLTLKGSEIEVLFEDLREKYQNSANFLPGNARELESFIRKYLLDKALYPHPASKYDHSEMINQSNIPHDDVTYVFNIENHIPSMFTDRYLDTPVAQQHLFYQQNPTIETDESNNDSPDDSNIIDDHFYSFDGELLDESNNLTEEGLRLQKLLTEKIVLAQIDLVKKTLSFHRGSKKLTVQSLHIAQPKLDGFLKKYGITYSDTEASLFEHGFKPKRFILAKMDEEKKFIQYLLLKNLSMKIISKVANLGEQTVRNRLNN